ncbi:MAG TPA: glycosyltransferase 87 family protein [Candidatus Eremiobacteraceae bacterium]|nr:glycosyltransferase 87 family protein [Candidatus Eremiobacteraceae bacterium]
MRDIRRWAVPAGVMIAAAAAGSAIVGAIAHAIPNATEAGPHGAYLAVIRQAPIPVVQEAVGWGVLLSVWILFGALAFVGLWLARTVESNARGHLILIGVFAIAGIVLTFFPIAQSIDIYYYAVYGRLYGVYGLNPYDIVAPLRIPDPILTANLMPLSNPPFADSYGPGFTLLAGLAGRLETAAPLWWQLWTWRAAALAATVAMLAAISRLLRRAEPANRVRRLAAVAFHPLVLYEAAVGGHNDLVMVAPAVWAFAIVDGTPLLAGLLLGVAIAVKYMAAIALPFLALRAWKRGAAGAALACLIAIAIPVICARPFALGEQAAGTLATVGSQLSMSLLWLLTLPFFASGTQAVPVIAGAAPLPLLGVLTWPRAIQLALVAGMASVVVWSVIRYAGSAVRSYLYRPVTALAWAIPAMHPWYLTWLAPALAEEDRWSTYAAWYLGLGFLVYAHEGVVQTPWAQTVFAAITLAMLGVPVVAARIRRDTAASRPAAINRT